MELSLDVMGCNLAGWFVLCHWHQRELHMTNETNDTKLMKEQEKLIRSPFDLHKHFWKVKIPNGFPLSAACVFEAIVDHAQEAIKDLMCITAQFPTPTSIPTLFALWQINYISCQLSQFWKAIMSAQHKTSCFLLLIYWLICSKSNILLFFLEYFIFRGNWNDKLEPSQIYAVFFLMNIFDSIEQHLSFSAMPLACLTKMFACSSYVALTYATRWPNLIGATAFG